MAFGSCKWSSSHDFNALGTGQLTHSTSSQAEMAPGPAALLAPTRTTLASPQSGSSAVWVKCSLGQVQSGSSMCGSK